MLFKPISQLSATEQERLLTRETALKDVLAPVTIILNEVKENGDAALRKYTLQFDKANIGEIEVSHKEIHEAVFSLDKKLLTHLKKASLNIRAFHEAQLQKDWMKEFSPGIKLGQHITPLGTIGAYVPGGRATYPSTALMTVIPACLLYTSDAADDLLCVDLGGR